MRWPLRREAVPEQVREQLTLAPSERVLVGAAGAGGWVVATTHSLWLPVRTRLERIGWEQVDSAGWDEDDGVLRVVQAAPLGGKARQWVVRLEDARDLLLVVKERVRATMVLSRRLELAPGRGVSIVARRPPGTDVLAWTVSVDGGVDVDDPAVRQPIEHALRELKAQVGA